MASKLPPERRVLRALVVTLFGVLVIFAGLVLSAVIGRKAAELTGSQPGALGIAVMANEAVFILVTLLVLHRLHEAPHLGHLRKALAWGIPGGFVLLLADSGLTTLVKHLGYKIGLEDIFLPVDRTDLAVWLSMLLLIPLGEEGFFRGLLPALYEKAGAPGWLSALLCCALFGIIHGGQQPPAIAVAFLMGYGFIALKRLSGGLLAPMLAHFIVDAAGLWLLLHSPPMK
jgi:membrane protease YdiL (CAAX protease family)